MKTITIREYLTRKKIPFKEVGNEILTPCFFKDCDKDSTTGEAHLYFSVDTGQYDCKKCHAQGNLHTLKEHFGDKNEDIILSPSKPSKTRKRELFNNDLVEECHLAMPDNIRKYLNDRSMNNDSIGKAKLGYGNFYGHYWITIPVADEHGKYQYFKLRQDPEDKANPVKYKFYPAGANASLYGLNALKDNNDHLVICEGEFDCLVLQERGIPAITSTAGAGTFKQEWLPRLGGLKRISICFDKDEAGKSGMEKLISQIQAKFPYIQICRIELPERMTEGKDITDYFCRYGGDIDELMGALSKPIPNENVIDITKFKPLTVEELNKILSLTIKHDEENKAATFLCALLIYSGNDQFNISFNAPSSTGKSYIPTEIAALFPGIDVLEIGYCSPTAFFHDVGEYDQENNCYIVDLSGKLLIFLDQPHTLLIEHLRPLLSHDKKEIKVKITDKSQKFGLKAKNVVLRGFPSVIFCSASVRIDEQESTRFLLLSPNVNQEKIKESISIKIKKGVDKAAYNAALEADSDRQLLKQRLIAIKLERIKEINIPNEHYLLDRFLKKYENLKPRHQRDIGRVMALIKAFALMNLWWRPRKGSTITASNEDIEAGFKLWETIAVSQEYNLPPYIYNLFQDVIMRAWNDKNKDVESLTGPLGLSRQEIMTMHYKVYGRMLDGLKLRQQILPMLETAGLITQEPDPKNKRQKLIYPTSSPTISDEKGDSESDGGVDTESTNLPTLIW